MCGVLDITVILSFLGGRFSFFSFVLKLDHRIAGDGRDLKRSSNPMALVKQVPYNRWDGLWISLLVVTVEEGFSKSSSQI